MKINLYIHTYNLNHQMSLFVDLNNSTFSLIIHNSLQDKFNLFQKDGEAFKGKFIASSFSAVVFKHFSNLGEGFMLFRCSTKDPKKVVIHLRFTLQNLECQSLLLLKQDISSLNNLLEGTKSKGKRILEALGMQIDSKSVVLKSVSCKKIKKLITKMDSDLKLNSFKFGIAYLDRFDTSEQQMLSNTIEDSGTSTDFSIFLSGLGREINLKGWKGFSGGLDVSDECLTGERAIFNQFKDGSEIIYHVAPWIPQRSDDEYNLERKRHFGNDTIVIIYSESLYAFEMQTILSHQIQVVLFVRFVNRLQKYEIHIYSKIPNLVIETNPIYLGSTPRDFEIISELLIHLERQCYNTPPLIDKLYCMRNFIISKITNKFI